MWGMSGIVAARAEQTDWALAGRAPSEVLAEDDVSHSQDPLKYQSLDSADVYASSQVQPK